MKKGIIGTSLLLLCHSLAALLILPASTLALLMLPTPMNPAVQLLTSIMIRPTL